MAEPSRKVSEIFGQRASIFTGARPRQGVYEQFEGADGISLEAFTEVNEKILLSSSCSDGKLNKLLTHTPEGYTWQHGHSCGPTWALTKCDVSGIDGRPKQHGKGAPAHSNYACFETPFRWDLVTGQSLYWDRIMVFDFQVTWEFDIRPKYTLAAELKERLGIPVLAVG